MALSLNTGYTYYANILHCLVVDSGVMVDLAGGVTFANNGSPTYSSTTWAGDSSSVEYVETDGTNYLDVSTGTLNLRFGGNTTVFLAAADFVSSSGIGSGANYVAGTYSSQSGVLSAATNFATYLGVRTNSSNYCYSTSTFFTDAGLYGTRAGQTTAAWTSTGSTSRAAYEDGSSVTPASQASQASPVTFGLTKWGISSDDSARWIGAKWMCFVVMDTTLDDTAVAGLHESWPTLLLSGGGTSVAPLAMSAYSRMRNG